MTKQLFETTCCIIGGGPAGMMLGYLLARRGVAVTVLEKHKDFFRDFRGDTVHPSTLEVMFELGLLPDFLKVPHQQVASIGASFGDFTFKVADVSHLPTHCRFVALMPQWDFLDFLAQRGRQMPNFNLRMEHEVTALLSDAGKIRGVIAQTPAGEVHFQAHLVIGCDGRHSMSRHDANLPLIESGVPIDVLWFRISRKPADPEAALGNINYGRALVLINRRDYFQAGLIIRKNSFPDMQRRGLPAFREIISRIAPFLADRVAEIEDWQQVQLLSVQINRLTRWFRPGLLCIGDSAHAMSPAGGVGINLAIQDAVAAARILADPLRSGTLKNSDLAAVQRRREFPTRVTQLLQVNAHRGLAKIFEQKGKAVASPGFRRLVRVPGLQRVLGRIVGLGVRPEHVRRPLSGRRTEKNGASVALTYVGLAAGLAFGLGLTVLTIRQQADFRSQLR